MLHCLFHNPSFRALHEIYNILDFFTHRNLGDQVTVYADYGNSEQKAYPGEVTWISDRSEFTPKTILTKNERANLVYAVKIAVKNDGALKIGMYGGVKLKNED